MSKFFFLKSAKQIQEKVVEYVQDSEAALQEVLLGKRCSENMQQTYRKKSHVEVRFQ